MRDRSSRSSTICLQPLAVLARRLHQVELLLVERADALLGAEVDRHAQRGERRPELVRDGGDQVVLQLVEAEQAGHVLQDDGDAHEPRPASAVDRRGARQEKQVVPVALDADPHRLFEARGRRSRPRRPGRGRAPARPPRAICGLGAASGSPVDSLDGDVQDPLGGAVARSRRRPSRSKTSTGSGRLSIAACAACCACSSSPSELWRYCSRRSAIGLKSRAERADLVLAAHLGARPRRSPSPRRRTACAEDRERAQDPSREHRRRHAGRGASARSAAAIIRRWSARRARRA